MIRETFQNISTSSLFHQGWHASFLCWIPPLKNSFGSPECLNCFQWNNFGMGFLEVAKCSSAIQKSKTALGALSVTWATQSSQLPQQARLPCNKHQLSYDGTDPPMSSWNTCLFPLWPRLLELMCKVATKPALKSSQNTPPLKRFKLLKSTRASTTSGNWNQVYAGLRHFCYPNLHFLFCLWLIGCKTFKRIFGGF